MRKFVYCYNYADDIVLLTGNEHDMQHVLDTLDKWCMKLKLNVNIAKSNVIHFRRPQMPRSSFNFRIGNQPLLIVEQYKYLGIIFHENLNFQKTAETLSKDGGGGSTWCSYIKKYT